MIIPGNHLKPRLAEIEDISKAKRVMKMTHVAPDAVESDGGCGACIRMRSIASGSHPTSRNRGLVL
jgi:hypothetical protein